MDCDVNRTARQRKPYMPVCQIWRAHFHFIYNDPFHSLCPSTFSNSWWLCFHLQTNTFPVKVNTTQRMNRNRRKKPKQKKKFGEISKKNWISSHLHSACIQNYFCWSAPFPSRFRAALIHRRQLKNNTSTSMMFGRKKKWQPPYASASCHFFSVACCRHHHQMKTEMILWERKFTRIELRHTFQSFSMRIESEL